MRPGKNLRRDSVLQREIRWAVFPYADAVAKKHRPVLVVSNNSYNQGRDALVCAVTSNLSYVT